MERQSKAMWVKDLGYGFHLCMYRNSRYNSLHLQHIIQVFLITLPLPCDNIHGCAPFGLVSLQQVAMTRVPAL